jgi:predicted amidohydrolase
MKRVTDHRPRKVRVAAIQLIASEQNFTEHNVRRALALIDEAAKKHPDLIVLPEAVQSFGCNGLHYRDVAEPIPGPISQEVSLRARKYRAYIVFPMIERRGKKLYNTAAIFDRNGKLVGKYHKIHEPEVVVKEEKVTLGNDFPVFKLDFGTVGIMICWDNVFPEVSAILALKGAEIILFPHLIGVPSQLDFNVTTRARAVDNCVYIVAASVYRPGTEYSGHQGGIYATCIIGRDGTILAQAKKKGEQVVTYDLDLSTPRITKDLGVMGEADWAKQWRRERRPTLYLQKFSNLVKH